MTADPARWQRLEALFHEAEELAPAAWPAFLDAHCGSDPALREELSRLLASSVRAEERLRGVVAAGAREAADDQLAAGSLLDGRYRLVRELGRGGMGAVWLAEDGRDPVAVKLIRPGPPDDIMLRRFRAEREILAGLVHPNVARLRAGGTTPEGRPYLVMEYIDGERIDQFCRHHALDPEPRIRLFLRICDAVGAAHEARIIHRDLKPGNMLVTARGVPKLVDFGIARILAGAAIAPAVTETRPDKRLMTPAYASPEQVRAERVGAASDIYSLAVVLHELLTGSLPYHIPDKLPHRLGEAILGHHLVLGDTPVTEVIRRALAAEPADRHPSVRALIEDLTETLDGAGRGTARSWAERAARFFGRGSGGRT